jgi:hypothetical protein
MALPISTCYEGDNYQFLARTRAFITALPDIFERLHDLDLDHSYRGMQKLRFVEQLELGAGTTHFYNAKKDMLSVFPMAFSAGGRIDLTLYEGLGQRHWQTGMSSAHKVTWARCLVKADQHVVDRIDEALASADDGQFLDIVGLFHSATEKLQAIHIVNAMVRNSMSITQFANMSVRDYPATKDFCAGDRPYSLIPLLSAYAARCVRRYPEAFAQYCARSGHLPVSETSTEAAFVRLFKSVTLSDHA